MDVGRGTIRSRAPGDGRIFGTAALAVLALAALGSTMNAPWLAAAGLVVSALLGARATRAAKWSPPGTGPIRVDDRGLALSGAPVVPPGAVEYALPLGARGALVGAAPGVEHHVEAGPGMQRRLLTALGRSDDAVTVRWRRHLRPLLASLGAMAAVLLVGGVATDTLLEVPVLGGVVATLLVMFAVWLAPRTDSLTIGKDGVAIRKAVERFVPLAEIREVSIVASSGAGRITGPRALALELEDGTRVRIEVGDGDPLLLEAVRTEIAERRATARRGGSGRGVLERLVRDGRSAAEWVSALEGLLRGGGGFRDTAVSEDDVLAVLEDVSAPAEARIGAAIALARQGDDHADLVRMVAADVASPRLRVALDEATHGEASDERIDAAVAEEENAVGRGGSDQAGA